LDGYTENTRAIVAATRALAAGIAKIPGLRLMCEPEASVVSWTSDVFDIYRLCATFVRLVL
jgi:glutamate/tyrosine decarboxylase-like PLP-dependent enzyme